MSKKKIFVLPVDVTASFKSLRGGQSPIAVFQRGIG